MVVRRRNFIIFLQLVLLVIALRIGIEWVADATDITRWQSSILIHLSFSVLLFRYCRKICLRNIPGRSWLWVAPSLFVLLGSLTLVTWKGEAVDGFQVDLNMLLTFVVLIPTVEELIYRGILTPELQSNYGIFWGAYLSGIAFASLHTSFSLDSLSWETLGVPIGPLLLAWICDWIYHKSEHILFPIVFHGVCNGTALIFQSMGPEWVSHLEFLYLTVK